MLTVDGHQPTGRARAADASWAPSGDVEEGRAARALALGAGLALAAVHTWLAWGYMPGFWGDSGILYHQVERFATGEVPYRDFMLTSPPFALWVVGLGARVMGTDLASIWTVTSLVFAGAVVAFWWYASALVPRRFLVPVTLIGVLFAIGLAQIAGMPLPMGGYILAAPVGGLALLLAVGLGVRRGLDGGPMACFGVGALCGVCLITKQDFWAPALLIASIVGALQFAHRRLARAAAVAGGLVAVVTGAVAVVAAQAGWHHVPGVLTGYGLAGGSLARGLPSWELLTVEALALFVLAAGVAVAWLVGGGGVSARRLFLFSSGATMALTTLYAFMSYRVALGVWETGLPPWATTLQAMADRAASPVRFGALALQHLAVQWGRHVFPAVLPVTVGLLVVWRRRRLPRKTAVLLLLLLAVCAAARVRRAFEHTEWFHVLLEFPIYALAAQALLREHADRVLRLVLPGLMVLAIGLHWVFGRGPFTRGGPQPAVRTERGVIHQRPNEVADYAFMSRVLNRADPTGRRPVFSFGHNGGFAYFLGRSNPTPLTSGLSVSTIPVDSAVTLLSTAEPRPFLIYTSVYERYPVPIGVDPGAWEQRMGPNHRIPDIPHFERIRAGCSEIGHTGPKEQPFFVVYDCAQPEDTP